MYQSLVDYKFKKKTKQSFSLHHRLHLPINHNCKALIYSYDYGHNHLKRKIKAKILNLRIGYDLRVFSMLPLSAYSIIKIVYLGLYFQRSLYNPYLRYYQ